MGAALYFHTACGVPVDKSAVEMDPRPSGIQLTPTQSVSLHGWLKPRKVLTWADVVENEGITVQKMTAFKINQAQMKLLQPDIHEWINRKGVGYAEVPYMFEFPLHPISHLHGDLSTLLEYRYGARLLKRLGLGYQEMRCIGMNAAWMKMFRFSIQEWITLGLTTADVRADMSEEDTLEVFGKTREAVMLSIGLANSLPPQHGGVAR